MYRFAHVDVVNLEGETIPGAFTDDIFKTCKVSLERYRDESYKILNIFQRFTDTVERASIDEAYLDLTEVINQKIKQSNYSTHHIVELRDTYFVFTFNCV